MPFKSKSQLRTCFALERQGKAKGWKCDEWLKETPHPENLPEHVGGKPTKTPKKKANTKKEPCTKGKKVCTGPRGGKFLLRGKGPSLIKIYVKE